MILDPTNPSEPRRTIGALAFSPMTASGVASAAQPGWSSPASAKRAKLDNAQLRKLIRGFRIEP
jgi:hypothetical protein